MNEFDEIIDTLESLKSDLSVKVKSEINYIIEILKKEDFSESDIIEIQDKIEEISELGVDQFTRNELYNVGSILEGYLELIN